MWAKLAESASALVHGHSAAPSPSLSDRGSRGSAWPALSGRAAIRTAISSYLCSLVYNTSDTDPTSLEVFERRKSKTFTIGALDAVTISLVAFVPATSASTQWAIFEVDHDKSDTHATVACFRGTEGIYDNMVNAKMLAADVPGTRGTVSLHKGYYDCAIGALSKLNKVLSTAAATTARAGTGSASRDRELWFTGHSMGGGIAISAAVHVAVVAHGHTSGTLKHLTSVPPTMRFVMTFGAPCVVFARSAADLTAATTTLHRLLGTRSVSESGQRWVNVINNADIVPRVMGPSSNEPLRVAAITGAATLSLPFAVLSATSIVALKNFRHVPAIASYYLAAEDDVPRRIPCGSDTDPATGYGAQFAKAMQIDLFATHRFVHDHMPWRYSDACARAAVEIASVGRPPFSTAGTGTGTAAGAGSDAGAGSGTARAASHEKS